MSVYNPEADTIARIEALELEMRELRRKIEHANTPADKRALNKQIGEIRDEIQFLRNRVDRVGK